MYLNAVGRKVEARVPHSTMVEWDTPLLSHCLDVVATPYKQKRLNVNCVLYAPF
jgi:hypothetical protein